MRYKVRCDGDGKSPMTAYHPCWIDNPIVAGLFMNLIEQTKDYFIIEVNVDENKHKEIITIEGVEEM